MSWLSNILGQDAAKNSQGLTDKAVATAEDIFGGLAPYRSAGATALLTPQSEASMEALYGANPAYTDINNPTLNSANAVASKTLNDLANGPDYLTQAKTALADFQASAAPQLDAALRKVGYKAGETGRIGAEGVTTEEGTLGSDYARNLQAEEDSLISDALDKTQAGKYATLSAADALGAQQYGESASDRATKLALAEQGITNTENEFGQQMGRGLSLAQLGYSFNPASTELAGASNDATVAANDAAAVAGFMKATGSLIPKPAPTGG